MSRLSGVPDLPTAAADTYPGQSSPSVTVKVFYASLSFLQGKGGFFLYMPKFSHFFFAIPL
jgi:hypothetical protein